MCLTYKNMSIESTILVILVTTLFTTQSLAQLPTEPTYSADVCGSLYGNYTANSSYAANLQTVLATLRTQSSIYPFYNTSAGSASGSVYGQYYCRFDADTSLCSACISQASDTILTNCPNYQSAVIWYDVCTLRYHNQSMFGLLSHRVSYGWSIANVSDPDSFAVTLNSTLDALIKKAAYGKDFRRFAVGDTAATQIETTYFLVQCSPDLSEVDCDECLWETYGYINRCCGNWPLRARVFFSSCQMRYSNLLFYNEPTSPRQVLSPPPPSQPQITTSTPTDGTTKASGVKVKVGLAVIFLALLTQQL